VTNVKIDGEALRESVLAFLASGHDHTGAEIVKAHGCDERVPGILGALATEGRVESEACSPGVPGDRWYRRPLLAAGRAGGVR
jgi:hypothetical protein